MSSIISFSDQPHNCNAIRVVKKIRNTVMYLNLLYRFEIFFTNVSRQQVWTRRHGRVSDVWRTCSRTRPPSQTSHSSTQTFNKMKRLDIFFNWLKYKHLNFCLNAFFQNLSFGYFFLCYTIHNIDSVIHFQSHFLQTSFCLNFQVRAKFKIPKRGSLSKEENEARVKRDFEILVTKK